MVDVTVVNKGKSAARRSRKRAGKRSGAASTEIIVHQAAQPVRKTKADRNLGGRGSLFMKPSFSVLNNSTGSKYLACILDPESAQPIGYPDEKNGYTAVSKFINNFSVPWNATSGEFYIRVNPTMKQVAEYGTAFSAAAQSFQCGRQFPNYTTISSRPSAAPYPINSSTFTSCPNPPSFYAQNNPSVRLFQQGPITYCPKNAVAGTVTLTQGNTWGGLTLDDTHWQVLGAVSGIKAPSSGVVTLSSGETSFQIQAKSSQVYDNVKDFQFSLAFSASAASDAMVNSCLLSQDITDYTSLVSSTPTTAPVCQQYRVVAQSLLLSFQGDTLHDGGQIAGHRSEGGKDPEDLGWFVYDNVSSIPVNCGSTKEGVLKTGLYGFWQGADSSDYDYKDPTFVNEGELPCLIIAGKTDRDTSVTLRARVVTVVEWMTAKSYIPTSPSPVDPQAILMTKKVLQQFPVWHENPNHKKDISSFFNSILDVGTKLYNTVQNGIENSVGRIPGALALVGSLGLGGSLGPLAGMIPLLAGAVSKG